MTTGQLVNFLRKCLNLKELIFLKWLLSVIKTIQVSLVRFFNWKLNILLFCLDFNCFYQERRLMRQKSKLFFSLWIKKLEASLKSQFNPKIDVKYVSEKLQIFLLPIFRRHDIQYDVTQHNDTPSGHKNAQHSA